MPKTCYVLNVMTKSYGLIFDVDGVIADTEAVNARASIRVFADLFGVEGVVRKDFEAGLGTGAEEYVKAAATVHGLELTDEQVEEATQVRQEYFLKILSEEPLPAFPGVLELMDKAIRRGDFRVAIRWIIKNLTSWIFLEAKLTGLSLGQRRGVK